MAEPPQVSRGNRYVDFEAILKQTNALNAPEGANAATETACAKQATENILRLFWVMMTLKWLGVVGMIYLYTFQSQ